MHRALVLAVSFSLVGTAYAQPHASGWKRPQAAEHALRTTLKETHAARASLEPTLVTAQSHYQSQRGAWQQLSERREALLEASDASAKYPLLPWRRDGLTRAAWHTRTEGWRTEASTIETQLKGVSTRGSAAYEKVQRVGAEVNRLKEEATRIDDKLFDAELARAPRSLALQYERALGEAATARAWSSATWTELRGFNARQHPEADYYDYGGRAIVDAHMREAGDAVRAAEGRVAAVKQEIRTGAK